MIITTTTISMIVVVLLPEELCGIVTAVVGVLVAFTLVDVDAGAGAVYFETTPNSGSAGIEKVTVHAAALTLNGVTAFHVPLTNS